MIDARANFSKRSAHEARGRFQIDNPYTGEIVAERAYATRAEAMAALDRAAKAQKLWAKTALPERIALCERFCVQIEADRDAVAREITAQTGKPFSQAKGEVNTMLARARHLISIANNALAEEPMPATPGLTRFIRHEPVGVVLDIAAWNYPLLIVVNCVIPAVLAGNAVLIKHAPRTALTGETFAKAFAKVDAPPDLIQALHVDHPTCAELIARPEIGYVSFTGSVRGGHEVYREAATERFVDAGLELGGKDPVYVAADANLEHAIVNVIDGAMYNAGQSCCGVERIYVHESLYDKFVEGAVAETKKLLCGDPLLPATSMGPMAMPDAPAKLLAMIEEAKVKGGRVLCGGKPNTDQGRGRFFDPTVVARRDPPDARPDGRRDRSDRSSGSRR